MRRLAAYCWKACRLCMDSASSCAYKSLRLNFLLGLDIKSGMALAPPHL